jgi:lipoprotein-anchoring transpeptidase ErfK/SrfK
VGRQGISIATGRFWRITVLTAAGAIGTASCAQAAVSWSDPDPGLSRPRAPVPQRRQNSRRQVGKKIELSEKESAKPQGPLIIAISIQKQHLKIYDANGLFAEAPISTGMAGHPTPMGVFSVIQKQKLHHSNIYSGAPMPFMQRITWSGIAIHAGVLPGYPASHGCIRMPMAFAVKMYGWTKMGARVVVTPGEISPDSFSHPLLAAQKVVPQPVAADEPKTNLEKKASAETPVMQRPSDSTPLHEQTHTADAGSTLPVTKAPVTMSDATPEVASVKAGAASNADTTVAAAKPEAAKPATAKHEEAASTDDKPVEAKSLEAAVSEIKPAETDASNIVGKKPDEATASATASGDTAKTEASTSESVKAEETKVEAKADNVKTDDVKADDVKTTDVKAAVAVAEMPKPVEKIDDQIKPKAGTVPDVKKDETRLPDALKSAASKPDSEATPKRTGQIAVFISRKDAKLYVRQNFAPLYDVPVTIAPSDRPLGTHVFTAQVDKNDANLLHWSVVSLPAPRHVERSDEDERATRRRKVAGVVEMKPVPVPDSAAEALDRITVPADVMARINDALSTGGSIIVSDQGITAGETGEGTDFIVSLR